jgi:hypothetical protein
VRIARLACLVGWVALLACAKVGAQDRTLPEVLSEVNRYQDRVRQQVRNLRVVQLVLQRSSEEERKEQALVTYRPPAQVDRQVQWSNIGHPSNGFPLKHLIGFPLNPVEYRVALVGTETIRGHEAYKLQIKPVPGDAKRVDGFLWVSTRDFGPVKVEGDMTNPPFPIKSIRMSWDFEPGLSGIWMLRQDSTSAVAKIVFKTIKGQSVASYDHYELNADLAAPKEP